MRQHHYNYDDNEQYNHNNNIHTNLIIICSACQVPTKRASLCATDLLSMLLVLYYKMSIWKMSSGCSYGCLQHLLCRTDIHSCLHMQDNNVTRTNKGTMGDDIA